MESNGENASLSLSHYKPLPIHIFIGLTVPKSKKTRRRGIKARLQAQFFAISRGISKWSRVEKKLLCDMTT